MIFYGRCRGCGLTWGNESDLVADHNRLMAELQIHFGSEPIPLAVSADDVYCCPVCAVDFDE